MIFEIISVILGIIKILIFKLFNFTKITFKTLPRMNHNIKIAMKKNTRLHIGKNFRSRNNVSIRIYNKGKVTIGNNCFFNDSCSINSQASIKIGNNVILGQNVLIFDHDHDYKGNINNFIRKEVTIGSNVWIGANCTILKGVKIGDNVVIAACSLVRENIKSNSIYYNKNTPLEKEIKEKNESNSNSSTRL